MTQIYINMHLSLFKEMFVLISNTHFHFFFFLSNIHYILLVEIHVILLILCVTNFLHDEIHINFFTQ